MNKCGACKTLITIIQMSMTAPSNQDKVHIAIDACEKLLLVLKSYKENK